MTNTFQVGELKNIDYIYLIFATIFLWSSVWLRAVRWKLLFHKKDSPSIASLYEAEMIGYFGNNVLPLRLGELLRSYIVGKENSLSKSFVFGTVILERLMDTLTLALFGLLLLLIYPLESDFKENILLIVIIAFSVIVIMFFVLQNINLNKTENRLLIIIRRILDGLLSIRKERLLPIIMTSLFIWCIYLLDVYLVQKAFQFDLSMSQILTVLVVSSMALSIPSAPGMFGTFHAAVKYTMVDLFTYSASDGNSFAILLHAYGFILFTIFGAYYFMKSQFHEHAISIVLQEDIKNHR